MEGAKLRRRPLWLTWLPRLWLAVAGLFLLWQTMTYQGVSAFAAEWQFNAFGAYHPALTFLVLLLIFSSPLLLLRVPMRRGRERRRIAPTPDAQVSDAIGTTSRLVQTLFGAALAAFIAAAIVATFPFFLPSDGGQAVRAVISDDAAPPPPGPVQLTGRVLFDKTAVFNQDFLLTQRSNRFAPMVGEGVDPTMLRYFVELPPEGAPPSANGVTVRKGVLRKGGLPGELIRLYRYAGFRVDDNYYVLFASESTMRRPYFTDALELLVLAGFIMCIGGIYTYRRRRLRNLNLAHMGEAHSL